MPDWTVCLRRLGFAALLFVASLCLGVFSLRAAPDPEEEKLRHAMQEAHDAAVLGGRQACEVLTSTTGPLQPDDPRLPAIELLGHLRFEEGVRPLMKQIELSVGAALALARIGRKASHACAVALGNRPSEQRKETLMWVIHECENTVSAHAIFSAHAMHRDAEAVRSLVRARIEYAAYERVRAEAAAAE
jgi:hypothetical protein